VSTCRRSFSDAFRLLWKRPGVFLLIQAPGALLTLFDKSFMANLENLPPAQALPWIIPYFCISVVMTTLIAAATFTAVREETAGRKSSMVRAFKNVLRQWIPLVAASIISGVVILAGFYAYLVPGIIVMGLYLFLPQLIIDEPGSALMIYFNRSWRLARAHVWATTTLVLIILAITMAAYFSDAMIVAALGRFFASGTETVPPFFQWAARGGQLVLTLVGEAMADLWVCCYFLQIRLEGGNK